MNKQTTLTVIIFYCLFMVFLNFVSFLSVGYVMELSTLIDGMVFDGDFGTEFTKILYETYLDIFAAFVVTFFCFLALIFDKNTNVIYGIAIAVFLVYMVYNLSSGAYYLYEAYNDIYVVQ